MLDLKKVENKIIPLENISKKLALFGKNLDLKIENNFDLLGSKIKNKLEIKKEKIQKSVIEKVKMIEKYQNTLLANKILPIQTTLGINYPIYWFLTKMKDRFTNVLLRFGVHYVKALPGGGKSSIAFDIAEEIFRNTGEGCYINSPFEKVRYSSKTNKLVRHHEVFSLDDYFKIEYNEKTKKYSVKEVKRFNTKIKTVIFDEWFTQMNHRLNKQADYNLVFMLFMKMILHMRHRGIKRIYILSQSDDTDVQLMGQIKYVHEVDVKLGNSYIDDFIKKGSLDNRILGWKVNTFKLKKKNKTFNKIKYDNQFRKATAEMEYFDTYALANDYKDIPEDIINFI